MPACRGDLASAWRQCGAAPPSRRQVCGAGCGKDPTVGGAVSREQAAAIAQSLRDSPFDPGGDAVAQRVLFARLMATRPSPAGVVTSELRLGGTPAIGISTGDPRPDQPAVLYFHGGGYAVGTAAQTIGLPAEIA